VFSRRPLSTMRDVLILFTNGLMLICLMALSIVALLTSEPEPRPLPIRVLGVLGLAAMFGNAIIHVWVPGQPRSR
jgi:small-conductance mechanosensitive channel